MLLRAMHRVYRERAVRVCLRTFIGGYMALPIAMAGVSAGLSILGGLSGNAAIQDADIRLQ